MHNINAYVFKNENPAARIDHATSLLPHNGSNGINRDAGEQVLNTCHCFHDFCFLYHLFSILMSYVTGDLSDAAMSCKQFSSALNFPNRSQVSLKSG